MFKKDKEMFTLMEKLNTGFDVIVALVTDSLFIVFLGTNYSVPCCCRGFTR